MPWFRCETPSSILFCVLQFLLQHYQWLVKDFDIPTPSDAWISSLRPPSPANLFPSIRVQTLHHYLSSVTRNVYVRQTLWNPCHRRLHHLPIPLHPPRVRRCPVPTRLLLTVSIRSNPRPVPVASARSPHYTGQVPQDYGCCISPSENAFGPPICYAPNNGCTQDMCNHNGC